MAGETRWMVVHFAGMDKAIGKSDWGSVVESRVVLAVISETSK